MWLLIVIGAFIIGRLIFRPTYRQTEEPMRFDFSVDLPDPLASELKQAATERSMTPASFAAQTLEATLATRRLPTIKPGTHGARLIGDERTEAPERDTEDFTGPLEPVDIATADDVAGLADIGG
jgi:hypothetical protein